MGIKNYLKEKGKHMYNSAKKRFFRDVSEDSKKKAEEIKEE